MSLDSHRLEQLASRIWMSSKRVVAGIVVSCFVASFISVYIIKFLDKPELVAGLGLASLVSIAALLFDVSTHVDGIRDMLKRERSEGLLLMAPAVSDLFASIRRFPTGSHVHIDMIALHFENMSKDFCREILNCKARVITLRILLVTPDVDALGKKVPADAAKASLNMKSELELRKATLVGLFDKLIEDGRQLSVAVQYYDHLPVCYGFNVISPIDVCYITLCRWNSPNPMTDHYHRVEKATATAPEYDLHDVFRSMFDRSWVADVVPVWRYPPLAEQSARKAHAAGHARRGEATAAGPPPESPADPVRPSERDG
jgi:hypothetical protein